MKNIADWYDELSEEERINMMNGEVNENFKTFGCFLACILQETGKVRESAYANTTRRLTRFSVRLRVR